jgi:cytochrome c oxidase subunit 2
MMTIIESLSWPIFWIVAVIFVVAEGLLLYSVIRFRQRTGTDGSTNGSAARTWRAIGFDIFWTLLPALATLAVVLLVLRALLDNPAANANPDNAPGITLASVCFRETVNPAEAAPALLEPDETLVITGKQWWWEIAYPGHDLLTAADIYVPVNAVVLLEMTSENESYAWWAPQADSAFSISPEQTSYVWLRASKPGIYEGVCGEKCDDPQAYMPLRIVALEPAAFARWAQQQQDPVPEPTTPLAVQGEALMRSKGCLGCHALRGVNERARVGPDLSNMASRQQIAGVVPYSKENMRRWMADPAALKPGTRMPRLPLSDEELDALIAYMHTLE